MLVTLATFDCLRFLHVVMAMAFTTRLGDLTSAHPFLQTGNARADDERQNRDNRQGHCPIPRWEQVSHRALVTRVRGEPVSVNPSVSRVNFKGFQSVVLAQAGIQKPYPTPWMPAFAGMALLLAIHQNFHDSVLVLRWRWLSRGESLSHSPHPRPSPSRERKFQKRH